MNTPWLPELPPVRTQNSPPHPRTAGLAAATHRLRRAAGWLALALLLVGSVAAHAASTLTLNRVGAGDVYVNGSKVNSYPFSQSYTTGTVVTLNASGGSGWSLVQWSGALSGANPVQSITLSANKSLVAWFGSPSGLDSWTLRGHANLEVIAAGNGQFVTGGLAGSLDVSADGGITWANHDVAGGHGFYGFAYGNGVWVGVGDTGQVYTSADGNTWAAHNIASSNNLGRLTFFNNLFVGVGNSGLVLTSPDGLTWTPRTSGTSASLLHVEAANGLVVAVGASGTLLTSPDGITWTTRTSGTSVNLYGIVYANAQWVIVGASGTVLTSPDAVTWTARSSGTTQHLHPVTFAAGLYVAGGDSSALYTSPDAITWTAHTGPPESVRGLVPSNGSVIAVGEFDGIYQSGLLAPSGGYASLQVNLAPAGAVSGGAQWSVDGGSTWNASGDTLPGLAPGAATVTLKPVTYYTTPANLTPTLSAGTGTTLTATYTATAGSLQVTLLPAGVLAAGAQWSIDGGTTWNASGATINGLAPGNLTITFKNVTNYTTPANQSATITVGTVATATGTYTAVAGSLQVNMTPAGALAAGAQWSLDTGATWNNSGVTLSNVVPGSVTVTFKDVANYATPATQQTTITSANLSTLTGTYVTTVGTLQVTCAPAAAASAGAQWSLDAGATWNASGAKLTAVAPGTATVTFKPVTNFTTPATQSVGITAGATSTATGTYVSTVGSVQGFLYPTGALLAGAQWSVDGGATWQNSGATVANLTPGLITVTYKSVPNYTTPANQTLTVTAGGSTLAVGGYVAATGSLQVTALPAAAAGAGAQWSIDGGSTWNASGATLTGLAAGSVTVTFSNVANYSTPAAQAATITLGGSTTVSGTYVSTVGNLQVTLQPAAAVTAGAQWSIDGGTTWNASGATLSNLALGVTPTVTFKSVANFAAPADLAVSLSSGSTSTVTGTYQPTGGTLQVTLQPAGAVSAGAQWSVDGGTTWLASGATASGLAIGTITVTLKPATGYQTPLPLGVSNVAGQALQLTLSYPTTTNGTVTFAAVGNGSTTPTSAPLPVNGTVSSTATPATDAVFVNWTDADGHVAGTDPTLTVSGTYTAHFTARPWVVTFTSGGHGTITPAATQSVTPGGSTTAVAAVPATGYTFAYLADQHGTHYGAGTDGSALVVTPVTADLQLTAIFVPITHVVAFSAAGGPATGSVTPASVTVNEGSTTTSTATAATGWDFVNWTSDAGGAEVATTPALSTPPVTTDGTAYTAHFTQHDYVLTMVAAHGTPTGVAPSYHYGDSLAGVGVTADAGWTFTGYALGLPATMPATDLTVTATFAQITWPIVATAGANGSISPAGTVIVGDGSTPTFTFTPATGYHVVDVQVDGSTVGTSPTYTFAPAHVGHTIVASFARNSYAITASTSGIGSVSPAGVNTVLDGSTPTYTFTPGIYFHLADVLVDGVSVGSSPTYTFAPVHAAHTIAASFTINTYTLYASATGNGTIAPAGTVTRPANANQTYTLTPATGYQLQDVLVDGVSVGTSLTYTFGTISANHTIAATFIPLATYVITATASSGGTVTPAGTQIVSDGATPTFTFAPDTGYHLASVLVDGSPAGTTPTYTFAPVHAAHSIAATFALDTFVITATSGGNGTVSPAGATTVTFGATPTYSITPASGYHVVDVLVDGTAVGAVTSYAFGPVATDHTLEATFAINTFTITASAGANGSVTPAGVTTVNDGDTPVFSFTPATGYHVATVLVDGSAVGAPGSYTFPPVHGNHTVAVTFAFNTYTITATMGANGVVSPAGSTPVLEGGSQAYTITPTTGYAVADVQVDGSSVGAVTAYAFTNVAANHRLTARFRLAVTGAGGSPVWSMGDNSYGQLGTGNNTAHTTPVKVVAGGVLALAAGMHHSLFIKADGSLWATGWNGNGQLGIGDTNNRNSPVQVVPSGVVAVAGGREFSMFIKDDGSLWAMGLNVTGQLGTGDTTQRLTPVQVVASGVVAVSAGDFHTLFIKADGSLWAMGGNTMGELGTGSASSSVSTPVQVLASGVVAIAAGDIFSAVVKDDGSLWTVGFNNVGQLGTGDTTTHTALTQVVSSGVVAAYAGDHHTVFVLADGSLWGMGGNTLGQLGNGTTTNALTPGLILAGPVAAAEVGYMHTLLTLPSGALQTIGYNGYGQLGVGDLTNRLSPTQVVASGVTAAAGGWWHSLYLGTAAASTYTITASASAGGSIAPAGVSTVADGATRTYTLTPSSGRHLADVQVDGVSVGTSLTYTFAPVHAAHTISATYALNTYAITASADANGSITPAGVSTVTDGATPTFTLTPATGYRVADLQVDGVSVGTSATYTFAPVHAPHSISATFVFSTYAVTASAGANGSVSPAGTVTVNEGATPTFTLTPDAGYHVATVLVDGAPVGTTPSYTFAPLHANHTLSATFAINTYAITASATAGGTVTPAGTTMVTDGATATYTITPSSTYLVAEVLVDGSSVGAVTTYVFPPVHSAHTISASFAINIFAITATAGVGGTVSPAGVTTVAGGATPTYSIMPSSAYHVADVLVDGSSVGAVTSYTFDPVHAVHTISASFAINHYTITASAGANGSISPNGTVDVTAGSTPTFAITPASGYLVVAVQVDGVAVGSGTSYTFAPVYTGHALSATFASSTYTIVASAGANGSISPAGSSTVAYGATASYLITPANGYLIADVVVDGVSVGTAPAGGYNFGNVTANHTISVTFGVSYSIGTLIVHPVDSAGGGILKQTAPDNFVTVGTDHVVDGSAPTYYFVPFTGYHIEKVWVDAVQVSTSPTYTFAPVHANHSITVQFVSDVVTVVATAGAHGSVTPSGTMTLPYGATPTIVVQPDPGYQVATVLYDNPATIVGNTYAFLPLPGDLHLSATFTPITYTITASAGANGSVTPAGVSTVNDGATPTYSITPASGYHVASVLVDSVSVGAVTSYAFAAVHAAHTLSATFAINTYGITASAGANGSVTPAGLSTVNDGVTKTYTITPASGYHVADVQADSVSVGTVTSYAFVAVHAAHTISASFAINTYAITASAGANGSVTPAGVSTVNDGAAPTYSITPASGYHVASVLVDSVSVGAVTSYAFTAVHAAHTISASFAINTYAITASAGANGSVSPAGVTMVNDGATPTYSITPASGYQVADVQVDSVSVGAVTSYTFATVHTAHTISASFAINTYAITASAGANGSVTPAGVSTVNDGATPAYSVTPNAGYHVADVQVDSVSLGAVTSYTFAAVHTAHTISATFAINTYAITASAGANGSVTPAGVGTVNDGATPVYSITPDSGYQVADVLVDGSSVGAVSLYTFAAVHAPHTLSASFTTNSFAITASAGANGSVTPAGVSAVSDGATPTYSITPNAGYHVADVLVDSVSVGAVTSYAFAAVHAAHTISASFAINTYAITASAGANGSVTPAGVSTVSDGATPTFAITPATGYQVADVQVDSVSIGAVTNYTFVAVHAEHTISASFSLAVYTITASAGANGTVSPAGASTATYGSTPSYSITPAAHYHVVSVLVDSVSVGAVTSYTFAPLAANHTLSATFALDTYTITATAGANGTVTPAGTSTVGYGSTPSYSITPAAHYHVVSVLVDGSSVGAVTSYAFAAVTASHTLSATFTSDTVTLAPISITGTGTASASIGGVVQTLPVTVAYGTVVSFAATPGSGYVFSGWSGGPTGSTTPQTFTLVANTTVGATFTLATSTATITVSAGSNGTISPATTAVPVNTNKTFTITPNAGCTIATLLVDGVSQPALLGGNTAVTYTFTNVTTAHTLAATFATAKALTLEAAGGNVVSATVNGVTKTLPRVFYFPTGTTVAVTLSATDPDWTFANFYSDPGTAGTVPVPLTASATAPPALAPFALNADTEIVAVYDQTGKYPSNPVANVIIRPRYKLNAGSPYCFFGLPATPMLTNPAALFAASPTTNTFGVVEFVNGVSQSVSATLANLSGVGGKALLLNSPIGVAYQVRVVCVADLNSPPMHKRSGFSTNGDFYSSTGGKVSYNSGSVIHDANDTATPVTLTGIMPGADLNGNTAGYNYLAFFDASVSLTATVWNRTYGVSPAANKLIPGHVYQWTVSNNTIYGGPTLPAAQIPTF